VLGRTDDVINVAGHRLSTGAMEEVIASHAAVAECAVVGRAGRDRARPAKLTVSSRKEGGGRSGCAKAHGR